MGISESGPHNEPAAPFEVDTLRIEPVRTVFYIPESVFEAAQLQATRIGILTTTYTELSYRIMSFICGLPPNASTRLLAETTEYPLPALKSRVTRPVEPKRTLSLGLMPRVDAHVRQHAERKGISRSEYTTQTLRLANFALAIGGKPIRVRHDDLTHVALF